jgi:MFS family permease
VNFTPLFRVVAARLISRTGSEAAFFVGIWGKLAYELEGDATDIAFVLGIAGVTALIGSAIAGTLVDRFGPKPVLITAEILFIPSVLSALLVETVPQFALVVGLFGLTSAPAFTAVASLPPFLTTDQHRLGRMNALIEGASMTALITGSAAGAALVAFVSLDSIFLLDAATSLIAVAMLVTLPLVTDDAGAPKARGSGWGELRAGLAYSWNNPRLRFYLGIGASLWLIFGLFTALEPLFFRDILGEGPETIGWVNTLFGIGLVGGTVLASRIVDRLQSARVVLVLLALNGFGTLIYVGTSILAVVAAAGVVWGFVIGLFAPAVRTMLHINSPKAMVGRVMGTSQSLSEIAKLGPLVAAPALANVFGVQRTMAVSGIVLVAIATVSWRTGRRLDETRGMIRLEEGVAFHVPPVSPDPVS